MHRPAMAAVHPHTLTRMATIRDVAADAGVAPSTVSNVLSGRKRFPDATVARVLASVERLGYRPSPAARALALGRTNVLGLLASYRPGSREADVDVFMRFVRAAMYTAQPRGYDVLLMGRGDDELAGDVLADALVVMDVRLHDARLPVLAALPQPVVLVGWPAQTHGLSAVDLDFADAARTMLGHVADLGHREVAVLAGPEDSADPDADELSFRHRFRTGFARACDERGVRGRFGACARGDVAAWLDATLADLPGLTAVLVLDVAAVDELVTELHRRGRSVPGDVSLVALSPVEQPVAGHPDLTLVDLPGRAMVARAVKRALDELAGAAAGAVDLLPAVLHPGATTAAPGRGLRD